MPAQEFVQNLREAGDPVTVVRLRRITVAAAAREEVQCDIHDASAARRASQASTAVAMRLAAWRR